MYPLDDEEAPVSSLDAGDIQPPVVTFTSTPEFTPSPLETVSEPPLDFDSSERNYLDNTDVSAPLTVGTSAGEDLVAARTRQQQIVNRQAELASYSNTLEAPGGEKYVFRNGKLSLYDPSSGTVRSLPSGSEISRGVNDALAEYDALGAALKSAQGFESDISKFKSNGLYPKDSTASGASALQAFLNTEVMKTKEVERQLDQWITRAKTTYELENSELQYDIAGQEANMKQSSFMKETGIGLPFQQLYMPRPRSEYLSSAMRSSVEGTRPPDDYLGLSSALGIPGYAEGTSIPSPGGAPGAAPAAPDQTAMAAPRPGGRLSNISGKGFYPLKRAYLDNFVRASKELDKATGRTETGIPVMNDIYVGDTKIPAHVAQHIGEGSMPMPPRADIRYLQPGEAW